MTSKKGKKKGAGAAKKKANDVPSPAGPALRLTLTASPDFHEATATLDSSTTPVPESSDEGDMPQGGIVLQMAGWDKLEKVVAWFSKGVEADKNAQLKFSPLLTKEQRAVIHRLIEDKMMWLAEGCSARGWGEERYIVLHHPSMKDALGKIVLTEDQEIKALNLWKWASDAGISCSRDEIKERVSANAFTPELVELWKKKSAEQRVVEALNLAVQRNEDAAVRTLITENPDVLRSGVTAVLSRCAPLHCAAAHNRLDMIHLLLEHGAPLEGLDGHGMTALQVARKEEQCDAEGVLLQAGAKDPDADKWPGAKATPALQPGSEPASASAKSDAAPSSSVDNGSSAVSGGAESGQAAKAKADAAAPPSRGQEPARSAGGQGASEASEATGRSAKADATGPRADVKGGIGKLPPRANAANKSGSSSKSGTASSSRADGWEHGKPSTSSSDTRVVTTTEIEPAAPLSEKHWLDNRSRYPVRMDVESGDDPDEQDYVSELWTRVSDFCAEHKEAVWVVSLTALAALGVGVFALRRHYQ